MQTSGHSSTTNFKDEQQYYVAPSDLTNSENGGVKFKAYQSDDIENELQRVFADLRELIKNPRLAPHERRMAHPGEPQSDYFDDSMSRQQ